MTDNSFTGPMSMVKIDGSKIKLLREQQGLTQLYLATAVEVTTDTISRWENKRYPSIKRDNGLKLATALNVQLEDLLEDTQEAEESSVQVVHEEISTTVDVPHPQGPDLTKDNGQPTDVTSEGAVVTKTLKKSWPLIILSSVMFTVVLSFTWYFFQSQSTAHFTVWRVLPPHCIANQPFPVLIKISGAPSAPTALILKENLPNNSIIHSSSPKIGAGAFKNGQIKWLQKIRTSATFSYMISLPGQHSNKADFSGKASISGNSETPIIGQSNIHIGQHHWADIDKDNVISDDEILTVYDQYSELTDIESDIDLVEEIWMGSKYEWDSSSGSFNILE